MKTWPFIVCALGSAWGTSASSQTTPPAGTLKDTSGQVSEVVVTAQRRAENLQSVPLTVAAFSGQQLAKFGVTNTLDLATIVPGLVFNDGVGLGSPYLRGVGSVADGVGTENPVGVYVDGVYMPSKAAAVDSFSDIDRIEVLKGPQGTLFGRNTTGGLLQIITKDPKPDFGGTAQLGYGDYNTSSGSIFVTGSLTSNITADVASYFDHQGDGFGTNLGTGQPINKTDDYGIRAKLLYTPTDRTRVVISADYTDRKTSIGVAYRPIYGDKPLFGPLYTGGKYDANENIDPYLKTADYGGSLKVEQRFDGFSLNSITAFRQTDYHLLLDEVYEPIDAFTENVPITENAVSQEFQAVGEKSNGFQWQAGTFLFFTNSKQSAVLQGFIVPGPTIRSETAVGEQPTQSYAAYGQATQDLPFDTKLTVGLRYTYENHDLHAYNIITTLAGANVAAGAPISKSASFDAPTWRLSLDHKFSSNVMGYVSYNRGFDSGLFNALSPTSAAVRPETLDAYEVGLKSTLFDRRITLNAAAFYYNYTDIQLSKFVNGIQQINNAASAVIDGLDIDFQAAITPNLRVSGGVEYLNSFFVSYPNAPIGVPLPGGGNVFASASASGNQLADAPRWTPSITGDYTAEAFGGKTEVIVTYSYNSGFYAEADDEVHQPGYSLVNASISWSPKGAPYKFTLWGKNLTNQFHSATETNQGFGTVLSAAPPLTFGANVQVKF